MRNWYKNPCWCNCAISTALYADLNSSVKLWLHRIWIRAPHLSSTSPYSVSYTEQTCRLWKPIDMKLDMCDANFQKHQFSDLPAYYCFEAITWYSSSFINWIVYYNCFTSQVSVEREKHVFLLPMLINHSGCCWSRKSNTSHQTFN